MMCSLGSRLSPVPGLVSMALAPQSIAHQLLPPRVGLGCARDHGRCVLLVLREQLRGDGQVGLVQERLQQVLVGQGEAGGGQRREAGGLGPAQRGGRGP